MLHVKLSIACDLQKFNLTGSVVFSTATELMGPATNDFE